MKYQMLVGLQVTDQERYTAYRTEMRPLLEAAGGGFRFDCEVSRVLQGPNEAGVNRLFVIEFPSRDAKEAFFSDPRYVEIRTRLFVSSVGTASILAEYEWNPD
jgi:uncharacterized protein (DUF1330 family)